VLCAWQRCLNALDVPGNASLTLAGLGLPERAKIGHTTNHDIGVSNVLIHMKLARASLAHVVCLGCFIVVSCSGKMAAADPVPTEPPEFTSSNHLLDLLVIAEPSTITLGDRHPVAWVFEMCRTADAQYDNCPPGSRTFAPYGGIRLQLYSGDHLRMRLINRLPPLAADAVSAHGSDAMMNSMLQANPVNLHTHGLIVEPRKAGLADHSYGDYVYVLGYPAGKLPPMVSPDETATDQPIQYDIYIPSHHPPGIYWFHPHVHGLSINQLSEGLSGIITIGRVADYLSAAAATAIHERYIMLKDMQVLGNSKVLDQEDSAFCAPYDLAYVQRNGYCQGRNTSGGDGDVRLVVAPQRTGLHHPGSTGADYTGGLWFFTINGDVYPEFPAPSGAGELWRIVNAGASRTYDLMLRDDQTKGPISFQIVSLNGASLAPPAGTTGVGDRPETANTLDAIPCPDLTARAFSTPPLCATHLVMFPGARAEIWVTPQAHSATLLTEMVYTGPAGDRWPQANLAHVAAGNPAAARASLLDVRPVTDAMLWNLGVLEALVGASAASIPGPRQLPRQPGNQDGNQDGNQESSGLGTLSPAALECSALPQGHRRRIFFGIPASNPNAYGLGYEEVDESDRPVPGTFRDIAAYDPSEISVCLRLGPGNKPVVEEWELVNVSGEAHNFHMHQTKFYVLPQGAPQGDAGKLMDNVAVPNGGATCDGTVAPWRSGRCRVSTLVVRIPFSQAGDFVYHCHIGEHQDSGMMAHIRVVAFR
jgi:FtsP/CotA-like multicopper oxidase with cupredoxin domain